MAENNEKKERINLGHKAIGAIVLMLVLLVPVSAALYFFGRSFSWQREEKMEQMYLDILSKVGVYGSEQYQEAGESFEDHIRKEIDLTIAFLKDYVEKDAYTGPEVLSDGFVVRLNKKRVILPAQIAAAGVSIDISEIEEALLSGTMRTGLIDMAASGFAGQNDDESIDTRGYLSFGQICQDTVYAQITPLEEYAHYEELHRENHLSAMETAAEISGGTVVIITEKDGEPAVLEQFGSALSRDCLQKLGLTMAEIEAQNHGVRRIDGKRVHYSCVKLDGEWMGQENVYIVQAFSMDDMVAQILQLSVMIGLLMLILYVSIITYSLSEEEYILKHVLNKEEAKRYNPKRIRRRLLNVGVFSTIMILLIAFLTQSVIQMRQQTSHGKRTLQLLSGQRSADLEEMSESVREIRENWYLKYGETIASFLEGKPEIQSEEKLRTCCEITGADFIMLFDHDGNEILCSDDYDDFTISRGLGEDSSDFRRLLLGVPGIIHPVSLDKTTGLERQMIGVTVDLAGKGLEHGALILALMPDEAGMPLAEKAYEESFLMLPAGAVCLQAEKKSGKILYSTETSLEGKTVTEAGLSEKSLQDGYMDFCRILGVQRFVVSHEQGDMVYYQATNIGSFLNENLWYGVSAAAFYAVALIILLIFLLREYNEGSYQKWAVIVSGLGKDNPEAALMHKQEMLQEKIRSGIKKSSQKASERSNRLKEFFVRFFEWDSMLPEKRASLVFTIGLFVLLQVWVIQMLGSHLMNRTEGSLLDYLLNGDWMHGINLFALYSILVFTAIASLIVIGSRWILKMISGFVGPKGETVCMLLQSLIKYTTIIIVILMSFSYIGMLKPQVLASMGIGSFALSLGAKDTIADILSGILIVFNETVRVGDIVEYQGVTAVVRDVRIQSTQLTVFPGNDIMTVRNQQITSIINKSRTVSVYNLDLKISSHIPVERIDSLMEETLAEIKKGCPEIIGKPRYLGILSLGEKEWPARSSTMTIGVSVNCSVNDMLKVQTYVNREVLLAFEKAGIEVY